jgi:ubiquinone/menaquinone biosynthesis C-methylase UbiE
MLASGDLERLDGNGVVNDCRLMIRPNDDSELHPHDLYISVVANRVRQWTRPDWLDVGCGWHFDWRWEHEREKVILSMANIVGLDPDWQAVSRHRTITKRTVGTVETLPFASGTFDMVTANVVVEHLKYPSLAFAEIFRVLKSGGWFVFRTPSARSYFVRIARRLPQGLKVWLASRVIEKRDPADIYPAHYRANTLEVIQEICRQIGFREVNVMVTKARGILSRVPALGRIERAGASMLGITEGNLIVEVCK